MPTQAKIKRIKYKIEIKPLRIKPSEKKTCKFSEKHQTHTHNYDNDDNDDDDAAQRSISPKVDKSI